MVFTNLTPSFLIIHFGSIMTDPKTQCSPVSSTSVALQVHGLLKTRSHPNMFTELKSHKALYPAPSSRGVTRPFCQRSTQLAQVASTISLKDKTFSLYKLLQLSSLDENNPEFSFGNPRCGASYWCILLLQFYFGIFYSFNGAFPWLHGS